MFNKNKIEVLKTLYKGMQIRFCAGNNLHSDIKYIIRTAQIFGMFPVSNVLTDKYNKVCFKWTSPLTFYAIFLILGTFGLSVMNFLRICTNDFKLHLLDSFLFCLNAFVVLLAFFQLAMEWPKLLCSYCKTEYLLKSYSYHRNLKLKFITVLVISTAAIFLEHSLAISNTYINIDPEKVLEMNRTRVEQYFIEEFPFIFDYMDYSLPVALLTCYINTCNVFSWSFIDCFITIMSSAIAYRFKQINLQLKLGIKKKYESTVYWARIRGDYSQIAIICQKVNRKLGTIIIISFGANMYFIIAQLYKGLVTRKTTVDQWYFIYSFGVLLLRTIFVIMQGSTVYSQSKKPISYLLSLSNEAFNKETKRFVLQVYTQDTSLSGGQFFQITRVLLFQMAATIITYELFMVQAGISIYI